jgi:hypothetical protein
VRALSGVHEWRLLLILCHTVLGKVIKSSRCHGYAGLEQHEYDAHHELNELSVCICSKAEVCNVRVATP